MTEITLTRPDDWHLHLRDGDALRFVLPHSARRFERAIVMPNLNPPVTTVAAAAAYRERIRASLPPDASFEPLMTLYLTDATLPSEIEKARSCGFVHGVKYYPAGATTHSDAGVTDIRGCAATLEAMAALGMPLLIHAEATDQSVDVFDRETVFIERTLTPLLLKFPGLRVVVEHITTRAAVEFIAAASENVAATVTVHHLLLNRSALFRGGLRPHYYCLPVLKREEHRMALVEAVTSGNTKFFLGTDSAPHEAKSKESACGCAGIYTAHAALELYAEVFEAAGALAKLEGFASLHGADFYRLPRNTGTITLQKEAWRVPETFAYAEGTLVPLRAGEMVGWRLVDA